MSEYDILGRRTGLWDGSKTDPAKLAAWTFDTLLQGQADTAVRYEGGLTGKAYTTKVTAYDPMYNVTGSQLTLPATDPLVTGGVPATLNFSTAYNVDGTVRSYTHPAVGGLPVEGLSNKYNDLGLQTTASGTGAYLTAAAYSELGDTRQLTLGTNQNLNQTYGYEPGTRRLKTSVVSDTLHPGRTQDLTFNQDDAGNITSIFDAATQGTGGTTKTDNQCFTYDGHRRLVEAWTPRTPDCATTGRTTANLDSAAPYWSSYTYTQGGQRKTETKHASAGNSTTTYAYGTSTGQPHPLTGTTGAKTGTYTYDKTGGTTSRPGVQAQQTLTWNSEGKLATTAEPVAGTKPATGTSYLYDADGELLISRNTTGDGDTVLYLGDGSEVRLTTQGTTKTLAGTRYYTAAGKTIAVRTATLGTSGSRLTFLAGDHHGTSSLAIDATTLAVTKRYTTPFGAPRGSAAGTWPDDKLFLGKPADAATGLTHIGAREYDPGIGQFISVDPLLSLDQHQSFNGYSYANNRPPTGSDPSDLRDPGGAQCGIISPCTGGGPEWQPSPGSGGGGGGGGGGGKGGSGGTATTPSNSKPTPSPSPGPAPYITGPAEVPFFFQLVAALVLPDPEAWGNCIDSPGLTLDCGSAAGDIPTPFTKAFKLLKLKKVDNAVDAAKKKPRGCKCFLAGTDVLMADGKTKDIEEVKLGDKVQATDPETGEAGAREVTRLIVTEDDKRFNTLSVATDRGIETLTATHEHPFWSPSENRWVEAGQLKPAMTLLTDDGTTVIVTANRAYAKHARTYNLTVDDLHTYYVLAGETPVLVHNSNCTNWAANSVKTWGHTFKTHGAGAKNTKALTDRARSTGNQQGQWLDNDGAAEFLKGLHVEGAGPRSVRIPDGLGQVIMPDGSIVQARAATIVPSPNGLYKTGFPIIGPN